MKTRPRSIAAAVLLVMWATVAMGHAADDLQHRIQAEVDAAIRPVMEKYDIPGVAVGITVAGETYVFCYGVASTESRQPVTRDTLFEIGSVTKTLTATLASYAQVTGDLSLSDKTGKYLPTLRDSQFGKVSLLNLGTHTPGGLPLQVPENIRNRNELMQYFKHWRPAYAPGSYRTYSNLGIGMLGLITAQSMGQDFATLMEERMFPSLGMKSSYIHVPKAKMADYAQGYTRQDAPIRMAAGPLSSERTESSRRLPTWSAFWKPTSTRFRWTSGCSGRSPRPTRVTSRRRP